jgi:hypothetical protein
MHTVSTQGGRVLFIGRGRAWFALQPPVVQKPVRVLQSEAGFGFVILRMRKTNEPLWICP